MAAKHLYEKCNDECCNKTMNRICHNLIKQSCMYANYIIRYAFMMY